MLSRVPLIEPEYLPYWDAFLFLIHFRRADMGGNGYISLVEVGAYLDFIGVIGYDTRRTYMEVVVGLDAAMTSIPMELDKEEAAAKPQQPTPPKPTMPPARKHR